MLLTVLLSHSLFFRVCCRDISIPRISAEIQADDDKCRHEKSLVGTLDKFQFTDTYRSKTENTGQGRDKNYVLASVQG